MHSSLLRDDGFEFARYLSIICERVAILQSNEDDDVSINAVKLLNELTDLKDSLMRSNICCVDAWRILNVRLDTFVVEIIEPWVKKNYGYVCFHSISKTVIGKA